MHVLCEPMTAYRLLTEPERQRSRGIRLSDPKSCKPKGQHVCSLRPNFASCQTGKCRTCYHGSRNFISVASNVDICTCFLHAHHHRQCLAPPHFLPDLLGGQSQGSSIPVILFDVICHRFGLGVTVVAVIVKLTGILHFVDWRVSMLASKLWAGIHRQLK